MFSLSIEKIILPSAPPDWSLYSEPDLKFLHYFSCLNYIINESKIMENFHSTVKKKRPDNMNSIKGHPQQIHIETDDSTNPPCENNR